MMLPLLIAAIEDESSREFMTRLYLKYEKQMYKEACKYFSAASDIEDAVYEALEKLIDKIDVLQELHKEERLQYVIVTVKHTALNLARREACYPRANDGMDSIYAIPQLDTLEENVLNEQRNAYLQKLFSEVTQEDRFILEQKYILKWTDAEIAAGLSIRPASVRMRLTRAKRKLAEALLAQGFQLSDWL